MCRPVVKDMVVGGFPYVLIDENWKVYELCSFMSVSPFIPCDIKVISLPMPDVWNQI